MNIYFLSDQINICHIFAEQLSEHQSFVFASSELFFKSITSSQDYPDLLIFDYWLYNHDTFNLFDYMNDLNVNIPHIYFNDPCPLFNNRELHWNYIMANFYGFQYEKNKNEYCSLFSKLYNLVEKSEITPYLELIQDRTIFPNVRTYQDLENLSKTKIKFYSIKKINGMTDCYFELLEIFYKKNCILSYEELLNEYTNTGHQMTLASIKVILCKIRKLLDNNPEFSFLIIKRANGYELIHI